MLEEADRLGRLVDTLLTLSRADAGHVRLSPERVDLGELAGEVVNHLAVLAEEKGQSISLEALGTVEVSVDRLVLRQAAIDLLDNAIKYSPEGSRIRIVVREYPV
jgi:signal transduction histidine kinase